MSFFVSRSLVQGAAGRISCLLFLFAHIVIASPFLDAQRKYERFRRAETEKLLTVKELLAAKGLTIDSMELFLRVFKREAELEVWARKKGATRFSQVKTYEICSSSGDLGPKRRGGDGQVPEGAYRIDRFNPVSSFHLSLGLNYPNASDRILGNRGGLGGDIFIHGDCVTIGCVPIQDRNIQEVYLMCAYARGAGQREIAVHLFPTRLDSTGMAFLKKSYPDPTLLLLWNDLREVYDYFEKEKDLPALSIDRHGRYRIVAPAPRAR